MDMHRCFHFTTADIGSSQALPASIAYLCRIDLCIDYKLAVIILDDSSLE